MAAPSTSGVGTEAELPEHPVLQRLRLEGHLGARVRRGIAWTATSRLALQVVSLGSQAVLARLLLPQDYGLVALALVFNGLAALVTDLGLTAAVVQSRRVTDRLLSTVFWVNFFSGVVVTTVLFSAAPLVAWFYGDPRVTFLVQLSSLSFTLNVVSVPSALLQRSLRFKTSGSLDVVATLVGTAATIGFAASGLGAVSLVLGPLLQTLASDVLFWGIVRWRPRGFVGRAELRELWRFGGSLTGANILNFTSRNADTAALGRVVSAADLGLYSRSYTLMMMPLTQVTNVLTKVLMPAYAEMREDLPRLRRAWLVTVRASLALGLPVGIGAAASAPALVATLYGSRWVGMVLTLSLLSASVPPQLVSRNIGSLYQALGQTGLQFRRTLIASAITLAAIVVGLPWGITGVATALLVKSWVAWPVPLLPVMRLIGMSKSELWRASRGLLLAGAALAAAAAGAGQLVAGATSAVVLLVQAVAGATVYGLVLLLVERELVRSLLSRLRRRR